MFTYSSAEKRTAERVEFGLLSPDEIVSVLSVHLQRAMSVVEIMYPETTDGKELKRNGLRDPRQGSTDRMTRCETCDQDQDCPGHFGHIELARACYHYGILKTLVKIVRCICFNCSRLLIDDDVQKALVKDIRLNKDKFEAVYNACSAKSTCEVNCKSVQPKYGKEGLNLTMIYTKGEMKSGKKIVLHAQQLYQIFKKISNEDVEKMGLDPTRTRPDWMIITVLPVPPLHVRPVIVMGNGRFSEDDLTCKLADIIKANVNITKHERANTPDHIIHELSVLLQWHIATYFKNSIPQQPQATLRNGKPLKSITQRLEGKGGRLRGNLMGKRVDFSARTVITPDPILSIDQVGVPRSIAMTLTYPEMVTPYNIKRLNEMVSNGPDVYPGAHYIIRTDGVRFDLRRLKKASEGFIDIGYIVERHLYDGDVVIFNRQPSLHKMSMMGHRIKVMPYSTFRLNLSCTTPYNADFDGDEMNLHVPQSLETRAEVLELMMVPKQVVAANANKPVMGIVQDTLVGSRLLTKRDTFLEKDLLMNTLMWLKAFDGKIPIPAILKPKQLWTGKQVFSIFMPNVNMERESTPHDSEEDKGYNSFADTRVVITKGELLAGILDKRSLGNVAGSIIHTVWLEQGPEATRNFMDQTQLLVNYWLMQRGFTVGIGDTVADEATMFNIKLIIDQQKALCDAVIIDDQRNRLEKKPGRSKEESFEQRVGEILNKARDDAGKAAEKSLDESNNVKQMVIAGSKGSSNNISQMIACVGQQNVEGHRIPYGFRNRTLPHYAQMDVGAESRGFVENSYLRGLEPQEFFFHAMGGREGLIDTAVKTSETGYIQRRLVKSMEDLTVCYDSTVRNSQGRIIQFAYGEDGLDAQRVEGQTFTSLNMPNREFSQTFDFLQDNDVDEDDETKDILMKELRQLRDDRSWLRGKEGFWKTLQEHLTPNAMRQKDTWIMPVNVNRIITNAQQLFSIDPRENSDLHPARVVDMVNALLSALDTPNRLFKILLRSALASKRVVNEWKLNSESLEWVLCEIQSRYTQTLVQPGEMVGSLAAQSIGEPLTQMTLNTFHQAGIINTRTQGVPRFREIINVTKKMRTPSMTVYLSEEGGRSNDTAKTVQTYIEYANLESVTSYYEVWYDPLDPKNPSSIIEEDREFVEEYYSIPESSEDELALLSAWLLRIVLNREAVLDKRLMMVDIALALEKQHPKDLCTIYSDDNADLLVIHIRIRWNSTEKNEIKAENFIKTLALNLMHTVTLRGVSNVDRVFMREEKKLELDRNTGGYTNKIRTEWVLETEGVNLAKTLAVDNVDVERTMSNDITEVLDVLGIEACRASLMRELRNVIQGDGAYLNYRHMALLCDVMTQTGCITPITRHGINRQNNGVLMRSTFEETSDQLVTGSAFGETDYLQGVSENIIMGNRPPVGTGVFDVFLDPEMLKNVSEYAEPFYAEPATPAQISDSPYAHVDYSPTRGAAFSPGSYSPPPEYSPSSPSYSPALAGYSPSSPSYSPVSPSYSSPSYSPVSPAYGAYYSPSSPSYSPPATYTYEQPGYSPNSPGFSPSSPAYSPVGAYSPSSPAYTSSYSPSSPGYVSPASPSYSPSSPSYNPTSPYRYTP